MPYYDTQFSLAATVGTFHAPPGYSIRALLFLLAATPSARSRLWPFPGSHRPRYRGHQPGSGLAGALILAKGGSAIDAAISANAVLGVTEPMMNGIGGDLFLLYWDAKGGKLYGLNASGWAPQGLTIDFLEKGGITSMPEAGIHSVTVPGAVDGWAKAHQRFGRLSWKELFTPAIYYAENGYSVPEIIRDFWVIGRNRLKQTEEAQRLFLPKSRPPALGEVFSNPDLGRSLRLLAEKGAREFYEGDIARAIVKTSTALGGTIDSRPSMAQR